VSWIDLTTGQLNTSKDETQVAAGELSAATNLRRDRGVWEACDRYRVWGNAPTGAGLNGAGIGSFRHSSECEKIFIIFSNSGDQYFYKADVSGSLNAAGSVWGSSISNLTATQGWVGWQHLDRFYWAGSSTNQVRYISTPCGASTLTAEYKVVGWPTDQVELASTDYAAYPFTAWGTDSGVDRAAGNAARYSDATTIIDFDDTEDDLSLGTSMMKIMLDAEPSGNYVLDCAYIAQAGEDWSGRTSYAVHWDGANMTNHDFNNAGINDSDFKMYVQKEGSAVWVELVQGDIYKTSDTDWWVWFSAADVASDVLADVKKVRFAGKVQKTGGAADEGWIELSLYRGGQNYNLQDSASDTFDQTAYSERNVRYYVRYRSADGNHVSAAISKQVSAVTHQGLRANTNLPLMGTLTGFTVQAATSPWAAADFIDIYRLVEDQDSGTERYYKIVDGASNSGTYTYTDTLTDRDILTGTYTSIAAADFVATGDYEGGSDAIVDISAGCSWKGSNVLADIYGKVYFSRVGTYNQWLWPGTDMEIDPEEIGRPRTVQVAYTRMPVLSMVPADVLYLFTSNTVYAFSGETPALAAGPATIAHAYGAVSGKGCQAYFGGALYGTNHGLYWVRVPLAFAGVAEPEKYEDMTAGIRDSWTWLLGTDASNLVVAVDDQEIWCFVNDRFLWRDREGLWTAGQWADGMNIFNAWGHRKYGLVGVTTAGKAFVLGDYETDGATDAAGTNGTAVTWSASSRMVVEDARLVRARVLIADPDAYTNVSISAESEFGGTAHSITYTGDEPGYNKAWPTWDRPPAGHSFKVTLSGSAADIVQSAQVGIARYDERREREPQQ